MTANYFAQQIERKFKQGWSAIPPIAIKRTTTSSSCFKSLNTKTDGKPLVGLELHVHTLTYRILRLSFCLSGDTSVTLGTMIILMDEILVNAIPFTAKRSFDACVIIDLQQMATLST